MGKAYGIRKLRDTLEVAANETIFIGDTLFEDGNYYPVINTDVIGLEVKNFKETKLIIETIIVCFA